MSSNDIVVVAVCAAIVLVVVILSFGKNPFASFKAKFFNSSIETKAAALPARGKVIVEGSTSREGGIKATNNSGGDSIVKGSMARQSIEATTSEQRGDIGATNSNDGLLPKK
jgi:hypothetical protein